MSGRAWTAESETQLLARLRFEVEQLEVASNRGTESVRDRIERAETLSEFRKAIASLTLGAWRQSAAGHYGPPQRDAGPGI